MESFVAAAEILKERGAYKIYAMATHGLLSSDAPRLIEDSPIDEVSLFISYLLHYLLLGVSVSIPVSFFISNLYGWMKNFRVF